MAALCYENEPSMSSLRLLALVLVLVACDRPTGATPTPTTSTTAKGTATSSAHVASAAGIHYELRYTGGADPQSKLPMIVAIHGLGDRPENFARIFDALPVKARLVLPRGLTTHGDGFAWFAIEVDPNDRDAKAIAAGVERATTALVRMLDALLATFPTADKPVVTGFSQGGMLSLALAAHHPDRFAAAVPLAGWLPPAFMPERAHPVPIVALHGDADRVLPIEATRISVGELRRLGFNAELREYPGVGHTVSDAMLRDLFREIGRATAH
jgi:phospholipase/carboxylesterase